MTQKENVALVFGASGISGWALAKNLLTYPSPTAFSRIIALAHRPRSRSESGLPDDRRIELYSGIDLRGGLDNVIRQMQEKIPNLNEVSHVYYCAYANVTAYTEDVMGIKKLNTSMTYNAVNATDKLCPNLRFLVLQTGTNHYGVAVFQHLDRISINPPLKEECPRIPSPYGDEIFYYDQVDLIKDAAKGKKWGWCEVRPDQIIGYVPSVTGMTTVEPLALYLSLYRFVHGRGATVIFPGTKAVFEHLYTDSSQDIISKAEIYLSVVKPSEANGEAFNIADTATPGPWSTKWAIVTAYFGLKGIGPTDGKWQETDVWWKEHRKDYVRMCETYGLKQREIPASSWVFFKAGMALLDRNRELSLDKIRKLGFTEEQEVGRGHYIAFDRMVNESIIPPREAMAIEE